MITKIDLDYLRSVQNLSLRHIGLTGNNPSVACIIVNFTKDTKGKVLSFGLTAIKGRPHAEAIALKKILSKSSYKNLTAYISLEPCFKESFNSCSNLLVEYGIKRIVIDSLDPNKKIYKKGLSYLRNHNHTILLNNKNPKFNEINKFFFTNKSYNRPFITLKIAISKNGYTKNIAPKDITNKSTQYYMHHLRLKHDAIGVGYNTLINDKPKLTCRLQGVNKYLKKIIFTNKDITQKRKDLTFIKIPRGKEPKHIINENLIKLNINSLLIEGGASTFKLFLKFGIFDEIHIAISESNVKSKDLKYKISKELFRGLKKISHNFYGKDQIIVYKNTNV